MKFTIGQPEITTHSMLTTFARCPRMAMYKYSDRIIPRAMSRPLTMGNFFHQLLDTHYKGGDWKETHARICEKQEEEFFEEEIRDVPRSCIRLMNSYLWHYQLEDKYGFKVLETETKYETEWPDGSVYQCLIDALVEFDGALWVMDHKLRTTLPDHLQRLLDSQLLLYMWCLRRNGIRVKGVIWNYIRMKPPAIPKVLKNGYELSKRKIETDYVTLRRVLRENHIDDTPYTADLERMKAVYWRPHKEQRSGFFRREFMEKDDATVRRKVIEMYRTRKRMARYDFTTNRDSVERVVESSCRYRCSYSLICSTELFGGNADSVRANHYKEGGDPFAYYNRSVSQL